MMSNSTILLDNSTLIFNHILDYFLTDVKSNNIPKRACNIKTYRDCSYKTNVLKMNTENHMFGYALRSFVYARLKNGSIMPWQCPSVCPSVRLFLSCQIE